MKRGLTLLAALLLCVGLAACARQYLPESGKPASQEPAQEPTPPEDTAEPLRVDVLNIEFVSDGRDVDELLALKQALPRAVMNALGKQSVKVGEVCVTFGASDEATVEALESGAVDVGFLSVGTAMDHALEPDALERSSMPALTLSALVQKRPRSAEFTQALLGALADLEPVLAHYTGAAQGGAYEPATDELLDNLARLRDTGETVLHTETADVGGRTFTLCGVGRQVNDYACGIRAIEVRDGDTPVQTIAMAEAAGDPAGGLDEYTSCPEAEWLFRTVDVNFDGYDDVEVFGWVTNNTIPYYYWLWDTEAERFVYAFRLQGPTIDPQNKTLSAEYRESAALAWRDVYEWQNGELTLVSHDPITE